MKSKSNFYDNKVVYKPWGHEYIIYKNSNRPTMALFRNQTNSSAPDLDDTTPRL